MKQLYACLLLLVALAHLPAQAQNWRPFRPNGDVHAFRGASADTVLTLRVDSAAVSGTDSVYYFNRIMRRASRYTWQKSVNNQFGQQLRYNVAQRTYTLFWNGGPTPVFTLDVALVLKPFVPVGTTWISMNTDVGVVTTLLARGTASVDGVTDSIATFRVGTTQTVVLSKNYGLLSAPQDLRLANPNAKMLTLARRPAAAGQSYYNPLALLDLQPGDELGYQQTAFSYGFFPCYTGWELNRVLTRQQTADSIIYTFRRQGRMTYSSVPGCSGGSPATSPVTVVRLAASRRTGAWSGSAGYMVPQNAALLTYAYRTYNNSAYLDMAHPIVANRQLGGCLPLPLYQQRLYRSVTSPTLIEYRPGLDALAWEHYVSQGVGVAYQGEFGLTYFRRTNGTPPVCGSAADFATLLPAKAALATSLLQLYPNPAAISATLLLPAPVRTAATIRLLDALGRPMSTQVLPAGQTTAPLLLQGLAAGLYLIEVQAPGEAARYIRLQHQP
jgi:hypothetical protein